MEPSLRNLSKPITFHEWNLHFGTGSIPSEPLGTWCKVSGGCPKPPRSFIGRTPSLSGCWGKRKKHIKQSKKDKKESKKKCKKRQKALRGGDVVPGQRAPQQRLHGIHLRLVEPRRALRGLLAFGVSFAEKKKKKKRREEKNSEFFLRLLLEKIFEKKSQETRKSDSAFIFT